MHAPTVKRLDFFERYLSLWVLLCMAIGISVGKLLPDLSRWLGQLQFGNHSQVNIPIAILIWLMIYPMMLKIDFGGLKGVFHKPQGLLLTLFVNWLVKPFSMALLGWLFIGCLFSSRLGWIEPETAKNYIAGLIILTDGDGPYTLAQVAINDLIMVFAFAPIVILLTGVTGVHIPEQVLFISVLVFIVIPLAAGSLSRVLFIRIKGAAWFEGTLLPRFRPVTIVALLATLTLIFAFQAENIIAHWFAVLLLAVPILIQVYFNAGLTYRLMRLFNVRYAVAVPGALIGASNFFELAVAVAITLFGPASPAALATVVGVLVEVPVMLSVCKICLSSRPWYEGKQLSY